MALNFIAHKYRILGKKGEGTFSEVLKCQNIKDGTYWACKKMKQTYESLEQVNTLREVQAMRRLSPHENILQLHEVLFDKRSGTLVLICELMDMNIYELIRGRKTYLKESLCQNIIYQLLKSILHLHRNGIFHRDVKPENILIKHDTILKLADFGSCRSVYSKQPYTEYISTRWYRAPECLLTDGYYTYKMDIWSVGCVFFEIMSLRPLFPGANEVDQIAKIHDILGSPDPRVLNKLRNKTRGINFNFPQKKGTGLEKILPHASSESIDLIYQMCTYDPDERITARHALKHPYFKALREEDKKQAVLAKTEKQRQRQEQQTAEEVTSPVIRPPPILPVQLKHEPVDRPASEDKNNNNNKVVEAKPDVKADDTNKENDEPPTERADDSPDSKSDKEDKVQKDKVPEVDKDADEPKSAEQPKKRKTPVPQVGRKSPGGVSAIKYPASILHNTYQYQRRERERRRRQRARLTETGSSPSNPSFFPKVPHKPSAYQPTFEPTAYASRTHPSLPKIHGVGASAGSTTSTYLPSLTQTFAKNQKSKNIRAAKTIYGTYQLPSIDRR